MIPAISSGKLLNNFDANGKHIINLAADQPVPASFVSSLDSRLTDTRVPTDGSVTNAKVNAAAAIVQSKLSLNGVIPVAWIGTTATTVAQGNLAEYVAMKGAANGYAPLGADSKIDGVYLPASAGTGTVTSVGLALPAMFTVTNSPVTTSGTLTGTLANQAAASWFGNATGGAAAPAFNTSAFPVGLIPSLPASIITSGTLVAARLPVAVGVGASHAIGAVPDPGASGTATDYLARDMTYRSIAGTGQPSGTTALSGAAPTINWALTTTFSQTLSANTTYAFSGVADGWSVMIAITNTASNYIVNFPGTVKWKGGVTPTQTIGAKTDVWGFVSIGGVVYGNVIPSFNP